MYRFILFLKLKGILCEIFRFGGSQIPLVLAGREKLLSLSSDSFTAFKVML